MYNTNFVYVEHLLTTNNVDLVSIHPDESIFTGAQTLVDYRIHRIPIIDRENNNSSLHILSHHRILVFLISNVSNYKKEDKRF